MLAFIGLILATTAGAVDPAPDNSVYTDTFRNTLRPTAGPGVPNHAVEGNGEKFKFFYRITMTTMTNQGPVAGAPQNDEVSGSSQIRQTY